MEVLINTGFRKKREKKSTYRLTKWYVDDTQLRQAEPFLEATLGMRLLLTSLTVITIIFSKHLLIQLLCS